MTKNEYNGWYNYETWVVSLWMDNEKGSYDYWREIGRDALAGHTEDEAKINLSESLKEQHEENLPKLTGFAADLLNAAMSEVNWYEIAEHLIADAKEIGV